MMEKIMRNNTSRLGHGMFEDRTLANIEREPTIDGLDAVEDAELKAVAGGFVPITHVFRQTHDKREAHSENV
jgi:hypothetical protein